MVGTMVLGIFPREQNCGDVFLYVVGCQRILRLEVDAVESAAIAAALLHGKNTLVKTSLEELQLAEIDALLQEATADNQIVEVEGELAEELSELLTRTQEARQRPEYALFHIYLDTLAHLQATLHCIILSGVEQIKAALIVQDKARDERFSLPCPLGDALALALYADVPVGIVPALVQRALPVKIVLSDVPEEVRAVVEAILPSPERERRLQRKMDAYNAVPLITAAGESKPKRVAIRSFMTPDDRDSAPLQTNGSNQDGMDSDILTADSASITKRIQAGKMAKPISPGLPAYCRAMCGTDMPDEHEEEFLKRLLRRLVPETKVRM